MNLARGQRKREESRLTEGIESSWSGAKVAGTVPGAWRLEGALGQTTTHSELVVGGNFYTHLQTRRNEYPKFGALTPAALWCSFG